MHSPSGSLRMVETQQELTYPLKYASPNQHKKALGISSGNFAQNGVSRDEAMDTLNANKRNSIENDTEICP